MHHNVIHPRRSIRKAIVAIIILLATIAWAWSSEISHAGTYKMYTCNVPGHPTPAPTVGPWTWQLDNANTAEFNNCASGGSFGIRLNPSQRFMRPTTSASLVLHRPLTGPLSRVGIVRYRTWLVAQLSGSGAPAFISNGGSFSPPGGENSDASPWVSPLFSRTHHTVSVDLYCSAGAPGNCVLDSATPLQARGIEVDLYEEAPPSGSIDGGSILADRVHNGKESISYSAVDQESGVARVEALIGDDVVGRHDLEADTAWCSHTELTACRGTRGSDMSIDTSSVRTGSHVLGLRVTDAAGNRTVVTGPIVKVGGQEVREDVRLRAHFGRTGGRTHTSRFGQRVIVRGKLTDREGRGVGNAYIGVSEQIALPGKRELDKRRVTTRSDGSFGYAVGRRASSRTIRLRYEGRSAGRKIAAVRTLTLRVRAAARLKVSLRKVMVRYHGLVTATPLPANGKLVDVQGRAKGGVWQTFARRRTTSRGRFVGRYRLRVYRPGVKLEFRVRVPREKQYPFVVGIGRVVLKTVK